LKNQYCRSPTITRHIIFLSQTLDQKGILLKPIIALIPNVNFNLVLYFTTNIFSIKEHKRYNGKYTVHKDFSPGNPNKKTNIFYINSLSHTLFTIQYTYRSQWHPKP
jgi:hypothetical protein